MPSIGTEILPALNQAVSKSLVVVKQHYETTYQFKQYAFGEEGSALGIQIIEEIASAMDRKSRDVAQLSGAPDQIVTIEPGGNPWGLLLAYIWKRPLITLRRTCSEGSQNYTEQVSNYYESHSYYLPSSIRGGSAWFVDDVISSGSTLRAAISLCSQAGISVKAVFAICARSDKFLQISKDLSVPIFPLVVDD